MGRAQKSDKLHSVESAADFLGGVSPIHNSVLAPTAPRQLLHGRNSNVGQGRQRASQAYALSENCLSESGAKPMTAQPRISKGAICALV